VAVQPRPFRPATRLERRLLAPGEYEALAAPLRFSPAAAGVASRLVVYFLKTL
jgi:hypothetical protein